MIYDTPQPFGQSLNSTGSVDFRDQPIVAKFPGYGTCFVAFHPFLTIKEAHTGLIHFETGNWPDARAINEHCEPLCWSQFLTISGIDNYIRLDQALGFYHCAYRHARRQDAAKLMATLDNHPALIPPQVDNLPEIWQYRLLHFFRQSGYESIYLYRDTGTKDRLSKVDELLLDDRTWMSYVRIETPDGKVLIAQDFDQRFTYFLGAADWVKAAIDYLSLEGFYCDENTVASWSYQIMPEEEKVNWGDKFT